MVSERGLSPNRVRAKAAAVADAGLWDVAWAAAVARRGSWWWSRTVWEGRPEGVRAP